LSVLDFRVLRSSGLYQTTRGLNLNETRVEERSPGSAARAMRRSVDRFLTQRSTGGRVHTEVFVLSLRVQRRVVSGNAECALCLGPQRARGGAGMGNGGQRRMTRGLLTQRTASLGMSRPLRRQQDERTVLGQAYLGVGTALYETVCRSE
jgi:hypothetical protein